MQNKGGPLKVGLTGNIGSGKSTATRFFAEFGVPVFDADSISHELTESNEEVKSRIVKLLGKEVLVDNKIDRKVIAKIVFSNLAKKTALENILHPVLMEDLENRIMNFPASSYIIFEAPLLYEARLEDRFNYIILIKADRNIAAQRAAEKLGIKIGDVFNRLKSQISQNEKERVADFVVSNNGSMEELKKRIHLLHLVLSSLSKESGRDSLDLVEPKELKFPKNRN